MSKHWEIQGSSLPFCRIFIGWRQSAMRNSWGKKSKRKGRGDSLPSWRRRWEVCFLVEKVTVKSLNRKIIIVKSWNKKIKLRVGKRLTFCPFFPHSGGQSCQQRPVQAYPPYEGMGGAAETRWTVGRWANATNVSQVCLLNLIFFCKSFKFLSRNIW